MSVVHECWGGGGGGGGGDDVGFDVLRCGGGVLGEWVEAEMRCVRGLRWVFSCFIKTRRPGWRGRGLVYAGCGWVGLGWAGLRVSALESV